MRSAPSVMRVLILRMRMLWSMPLSLLCVRLVPCVRWPFIGVSVSLNSIMRLSLRVLRYASYLSFLRLTGVGLIWTTLLIVLILIARPALRRVMFLWIRRRRRTSLMLWLMRTPLSLMLMRTLTLSLRVALVVPLRVWSVRPRCRL